MASWKAVGYAALGTLVLTGTGWLVLHRPVPAAPAATAPALGSATVLRTNVTAHDIRTGSLGYLDPVTVVAGAAGGVLTWLPSPGTTIGTDQRLYEVDGRPVPLWQGNRPAWRDLVPGMPAGPDLTQAEQDLAAHGYGSHLTGAAIRRWQAAHGLPRSGVIGLGQVVFQPGPVRVATVPAALGTPLHPGLTILTATATTKAVTVRLDPNRQGTVHAGDRVTITLPAGRTTPATVSSLGAPVSTVDGQATSTTVPVTIRLDARSPSGWMRRPTPTGWTPARSRSPSSPPSTTTCSRYRSTRCWPRPVAATRWVSPATGRGVSLPSTVDCSTRPVDLSR